MAASQGVLFSEPLYTETGVWCEIGPCIDPAQWVAPLSPDWDNDPTSISKNTEKGVPKSRFSGQSRSQIILL